MDNKAIKREISLFIPDKTSSKIILLAMVFNAMFALKTLNNMDYTWRIMSFSLYTIVYTLLMFYFGSNIKVYKIQYTFVIIAISVIQFIRFAFIPAKDFSLLAFLYLVTSGALGILASVRSFCKCKQRMQCINEQSEADR